MACRGLKLAVTTALAASVAGHDWDEVLKAFEKFQHEFERKYHHTEKEARFGTFAKNYAIVAEENAKGNSYQLAINKYADLTHEEFAKAKLGYKPRSGDKPWGDLASLGMHKRTGAAVPDSVDWSQQGAVTAVKNQGQCGSCWAFSTTGSLEGAWAIATGKLVALSEQQLVDCSTSFGNQGCNGGLMDNGFKFEEGVGVCTEDSYAYTAQDGTCHASSCTVGIPNGGVKGFKDVSPSDEQAMMEAVAQGPVSVAIEADMSAFQLYHSGVLDGECGTQLDHGVLVTGYGTEGDKKYWLVKNSWGASWGLDGYIKLARGTGGVGMCGLLSQPSYPVVEGSGPGPSPPSPTPPSSTHYGKPPCRSDELNANAVSIPTGQVCAPPCDSSGSCPTDKPAGTSANPKCLLLDRDAGTKYCALSCFWSGCPSGAKCLRPFLSGICVFPQSGKAPEKTLIWGNPDLGSLGDEITV